MNKTLEGMARAICLAIWDHDYTPRDPLHPDARWLQAMKAARAGAGFLADNVSDEIKHLKSEVERLEAERVLLIDTLLNIGSSLNRYELALRFYADENNWRSSSQGFALQYDPVIAAIHLDRGDKARGALEGEE